MSFPYQSVLIACSVNTARSPMAEGFFKDIFCKNEMDIKVCSGGVASNARDGMLISMDAKMAMQENGIKLSNEATSVDLKKKKHRYLINEADLILTLTEKHKKDIKNLKEAKGKPIYTLKEFAGEKGDIADPSMKGIEGFRKARDEIHQCIMKALKKWGIGHD